MALGALIVALACLLAAVAFGAGSGRAAGGGCGVLRDFHPGRTVILPTGLRSRGSRRRASATTVAAWFATCTGSYAAGAVGTLWAGRSHSEFSSFWPSSRRLRGLLFALDHRTRDVEEAGGRDQRFERNPTGACMKTSAFGTDVDQRHCGFRQPPAGFENRVESLRKEIGVPGMAVAIVENDKVTLAKGFGVKR